MKVVIDIPKDMIRQVRAAVETGGYEDPRDFARTALQNQLTIESEESETEYKTLEEAVEEDVGEDYRDSSSDSGITASSENTIVTDGLGRRDYTNVPTVNPPSDERVGMRPLWGQYNRIFPVKLTVRSLVNYLSNGNGLEGITETTDMQKVNLPSFRDDTAQVAREYGSKLKEIDENKNRKRGSRMSTGLPIGDDPGKSKTRFKNHFVGDMEQDGTVTGAPPNLLFVNLFKNGVATIGITESGLEFAELSNPLLDGSPDANRSLSDEERQFYIDHVKENIPEEYDAMAFVAQAIEEGNDRPDELTKKTHNLNPDWTDSFASTMRTGLLSRMSELGLVERERVGQRGVGYSLSDEGREFFGGAEEVEA